jgi:hypothetical protein
MTTTIERTSLSLVSSTTPRELWSHPTLDLFAPPVVVYQPQEAILFTHPSTFGESYEDDDYPTPTSTKDLPDIRTWTMSLAINSLEIIAGRRQPAQIAMRCHRVTYLELLTLIGGVSEVGRIATIHQDHPFDGIVESALTVRFKERTRAMVVRAEGLDGKWLCTSLSLI